MVYPEPAAETPVANPWAWTVVHDVRAESPTYEVTETPYGGGSPETYVIVAPDPGYGSYTVTEAR